jgi:hypothetical protein
MVTDGTLGPPPWKNVSQQVTGTESNLAIEAHHFDVVSFVNGVLMADDGDGE